MTIKNAIKMMEFLRDWELYGIKIFGGEPLDETYQPIRIRRKILEISRLRTDSLQGTLRASGSEAAETVQEVQMPQERS